MKYATTFHDGHASESLKPPSDDPAWTLQTAVPASGTDSGIVCVWYAHAEREEWAQHIRELQTDLEWAYSQVRMAIADAKRGGVGATETIHALADYLETAHARAHKFPGFVP